MSNRNYIVTVVGATADCEKVITVKRNRKVRRERKEYYWLCVLCELCGFLLAILLFTKFHGSQYSFDDGSILGENYPNRSTRNMLTMQVGLGFHF